MKNNIIKINILELFKQQKDNKKQKLKFKANKN